MTRTACILSGCPSPPLIFCLLKKIQLLTSHSPLSYANGSHPATHRLQLSIWSLQVGLNSTLPGAEGLNGEVCRGTHHWPCWLNAWPIAAHPGVGTHTVVSTHKDTHTDTWMVNKVCEAAVLRLRGVTAATWQEIKI